MALATSIIGDGILVDADKSIRVYFVADADAAEGDQSGRFIEITETETRLWVALTKAAAEDAKNDNIQPDDGGQYSYAISENSRVIGSYELTRNYRLVENYKLPDEITATAAPTFDPVAGAQAGPVSVAVSCATANASIKYKTGTGDPTDYTDPDWQDDSVESGGKVSVPSPGWIKAKAWAPGYTSSSVATAEYTEPE